MTDFDRYRRDVRNLLSNPTQVAEVLGLADGGKRTGNGFTARCIEHEDRHPSMSITRGPDGTIRYVCHACKATGDVLRMIALTYDLDVHNGDDFREVMAIGAELGGNLGLADEIRGQQPKQNRPRRSVPEPQKQPPREYPPFNEINSLWNACHPCSEVEVIAKYLTGRAIDPAIVDARGLARALPSNVQLPQWAICRGGDWHSQGFRLIVPMYDACGVLRTLRAWQVIGNDGPKRILPYGHKSAEVVFANASAQSMLAGSQPFPSLAVVEGDPDYLTWSTRIESPVVAVGSGWWSKEHGARIRGEVEVYIRTHLDDAGEKYAKAVAKTLSKQCNIWRLTRSDDGDENDAARAGSLPDTPAGHCNLMRGRDGVDSEERPEVNASDLLSKLTDKSIAVLAKQDIYQRARRLVDITADAKRKDGVVRPAGTMVIRELPNARIREVLENKMFFYRETQVGKRPVRPPTEVIDTIEARGQWSDIRPLRAIANWPLFRPSGTILSEPGYDPELEVMCAPDVAVQVPAKPSYEQAKEALDRYRHLLREFPFVDDSHFASWMAMLLVHFVRFALPETEPFCPIGIIEAAERGTGKSMLADIIGRIVSGRVLPRAGIPKDPDEWRKGMLGIAMSAYYCVLYDNVTGLFKSESLDTVITGGYFEDRLLGRNERLSLPVHTVFIMTSNNAEISRDLGAANVRARRRQDCSQWPGPPGNRRVDHRSCIYRSRPAEG